LGKLAVFVQTLNHKRLNMLISKKRLSVSSLGQ
jgi:hypothetical protein